MAVECFEDIPEYAIPSECRCRDNSVNPQQGFHITAACPVNPIALNEVYSAFITVSGGTSPYTFITLSGSLPTGLTLNGSTGEISGTPTVEESTSVTIKVTDANGATDTITCPYVIEEVPADEVVADIMYTVSSPRTNPDSRITPYLYILPPSRDRLYRSAFSNPGSAPDDWGAWYEEAIPEEIEGSIRRIFGNDSVGSATGLADDALMMSKALCNTTADPLPQTDNPWIAYELPVVPKPNGNNPAINPNEEGPPPFWSPEALASPTPLGFIGEDGFIHSQQYDQELGCTTYEIIDTGTNELPDSQIWNRIYSIQGVTLQYLGVIACGVGDKIAVCLNADTEYTLFDCPSGDYKDIAITDSSNTIVIVGTGDNKVIFSLDYGETWAIYTPFAGWTPRDTVRITFDPNMYDLEGGENGTFIVTGGTIGGVDAIMLIPLMGDDTLGIALLAGLPGGVTSTTQWIAATTNNFTEGCVVIGVDTAITPTDIDANIVLSNPELSKAGTSDTYDDWHLMPMSGGPFDGLT